ncbi:hypothetical protein F4810DRAFT_676056 [Camillea tinctor]|nr:hypothetical protein F4810DRAFT_676056 [Camillea tinctor]
MDPQLRAIALAATAALRRARGKGIDPRDGAVPWHRFLTQESMSPRVVICTSSLELVRIMAAKRVQEPLYNWPRGLPQRNFVVGDTPEESYWEERPGVRLLDGRAMDLLSRERLKCLESGIDVSWFLISEKDIRSYNETMIGLPSDRSKRRA